MEFIFGVLVTLTVVALAHSVYKPKEPVDDWVMEKVHHAMDDAGIPKEYRTMAVANMQDAGIIFRTKKVHHETQM